MSKTGYVFGTGLASLALAAVLIGGAVGLPEIWASGAPFLLTLTITTLWCLIAALLVALLWKLREERREAMSGGQ